MKKENPIYIGYDEEKMLDSIIQEAGIDKVLDLAGRGQLFIPSEISLHVIDRPSRDHSVTLANITKGIVAYGHGNFGKVIIPPNFEGHRADDKSADYLFCVHDLLNGGILVKENSDLVFNLNQEGVYQIFDGIHAAHNGAAYFQFASPIAEGEKGRISLHRDMPKSLKLMAHMHYRGEGASK
ncbi:MAG: hypothetical protein QF632_04315 [Candidatus Woesearchaeota archaeon]|nr:hypothetical protein [Candidatus Woesearchaeota archaeon]